MSNKRRSSTVGSTWPSAVLENFYEQAVEADQPGVYCYTDRLSYAPGETIRFHVNCSVPRYALEIARDGAEREVVYEERALLGRFFDTPEDCSVRGCDWPVAFELEVPKTWRSGCYLVTLRVETRSDAIYHHHVFFVRAAKPGKDAAAPAIKARRSIVPVMSGA